MKRTVIARAAIAAAVILVRCDGRGNRVLAPLRPGRGVLLLAVLLGVGGSTHLNAQWIQMWPGPNLLFGSQPIGTFSSQESLLVWNRLPSEVQHFTSITVGGPYAADFVVTATANGGPCVDVFLDGV